MQDNTKDMFSNCPFSCGRCNNFGLSLRIKRMKLVKIKIIKIKMVKKEKTYQQILEQQVLKSIKGKTSF